MVHVRYIVPIVYGTSYYSYIKDIMITGYRPVTSDLVDFRKGGLIFSTAIQSIRLQVNKDRFDVYCRQRMYNRDDPNFQLETEILKGLGFTNQDMED